MEEMVEAGQNIWEIPEEHLVDLYRAMRALEPPRKVTRQMLQRGMEELRGVDPWDALANAFRAMDGER